MLHALTLYCIFVDEEQVAGGNLKTISKEARDILQQLDKDYKPKEVQKEDKKLADKFNAVSMQYAVTI